MCDEGFSSVVKDHNSNYNEQKKKQKKEEERKNFREIKVVQRCWIPHVFVQIIIINIVNIIGGLQGACSPLMTVWVIITSYYYYYYWLHSLDNNYY